MKIKGDENRANRNLEKNENVNKKVIKIKYTLDTTEIE